VTFKDGASTICADVDLDGNSAQCTTSSLSVTGSPHSITAEYGGATGFTESTSSALAQEVAKADATCSVTGYSVTYDGDPHTASGSCTGVDGEDLTADLDLSGTTHTNAGSYTDTWSFTDTTGNYNDDSDTVSDSIAKAGATIVVNGYNLTYDTFPHIATGSATGVQGEVLAGLDLSGTTHTFVGTYTDAWTFTDVTGNYLDASGTVTDTITTAFRIIGFDSPVDMTIAGDRIYNSVKNGQTVPLKFRVFNLDGTEVTSVIGLSAWSRSVTCLTGDIDPTLLPIDSTADNGLRRTGDRFHFNWAVPKGAGKCYQILVKTPDGSTTMVGSMSGTPVQEAYFKSK
jgi:hypothetical protein